MKSILVPINFSEDSRWTALFAVGMAHDLGAEIYLLHSVEILPAYLDVPQCAYSYEVMMDAAMQQMAEVAETLRDYAYGRVPIRSEVVAGSAGEQIKVVANRLRPFAVIMNARKGGSAIGRFFLGSTVQAALENLCCPLVVVPPKALYKGVKTIGLAFNMEYTLKVLPTGPVQEWADAFGARLQVVSVRKEKDAVGVFEETSFPGTHQLEKTLGGRFRGIHFISNRNIEQGLFEYTTAHPLDLLAVFPRPHDIIWNIFHKSHTHQLAIHPFLPLLILH